MSNFGNKQNKKWIYILPMRFLRYFFKKSYLRMSTIVVNGDSHSVHFYWAWQIISSSSIFLFEFLTLYISPYTSFKKLWNFWHFHFSSSLAPLPWKHEHFHYFLNQPQLPSQLHLSDNKIIHTYKELSNVPIPIQL